MANTTFGNLKIGALRRASNFYNANDATLLTLAGGLINDVMGFLQSQLAGTPWTLDTDNTVSTTASQAYVDLVDTDILEVYEVYQRTSQSKLRQIKRASYVEMVPDNSVVTGVPELAWYPQVAVNGSGNNIFSIYLIPTPSSVISLRYDYIKNLRFSADGTGADSEFSKLPPTYDEWIYAEFKPRFYGVIDPSNRVRIQTAREDADRIGQVYRQSLKNPKDMVEMCASARERNAHIYKRVATTPTPS